jgi:hypothetical protein
MFDEVRPEHGAPQVVPLWRQMKTVFDVEVSARLFIPPEHQVVEIEKRETIVSLTDRPDDLIRQPHPVHLQRAERARLDADVEDTRLR